MERFVESASPGSDTTKVASYSSGWCTFLRGLQGFARVRWQGVEGLVGLRLWVASSGSQCTCAFLTIGNHRNDCTLSLAS